MCKGNFINKLAERIATVSYEVTPHCWGYFISTVLLQAEKCHRKMAE
jgi:hypothetical protein